jgi:flavin-dependent dehydrogenase
VKSTGEKKDINNNFDIMIVGGGPAGLSTYLHLQSYAPELASRCVLIEKEKYPREKLCGGAVGGWSEDILKNLGIKLNINSMMIDTIECRFVNKKYIHHEQNYFRMVQRKEFDHFLATVALKRGLRIHEEETFLDFKRRNNSLIVKTNQNSYYKIKALVGADGSLSRVRKKINNTNIGNLAPTIEIFSPLNSKFDTEFKEKKVVFDFTPVKEGLQGYIWHFPFLKENKAFLNHGIVNFRVHNYPSAKPMKTLFIEELNKRNINEKNIIFLGHPIRYFSKDDIISKSNVILVGDAAGIEPATGGGIHLALSYGEVAANNLVKSFKSNNFSFDNYRYEFDNSLAGRYIKKLSYLAYTMYDQNKDPLDGIKEIFIARKK